MSKGNNWIALDKNLVQEFKSIKRDFSMIEAMYSYSYDINCGKIGTIAGYSKQWCWSRNKVRRFIKGIRTAEGHQKDSKRTHQGHPIHFIDKVLMNKKDSRGTAEGQQRDSQEDTTIKNKNNLKEISSEIYDFTDSFIEYIYKENPKIKKPNRKNSAETIEKLIRLDGHSLKYVKNVLRWTLQDDFWSKQIRSLIPLRKKAENGFLKFENIINAYERIKPLNNIASIKPETQEDRDKERKEAFS